MNKPNFDKLMLEQIASFTGRKKLLLHCCCAPCSSACLERLKDYFDVSVLFYNPNIEDEEYERRKAELIRLIETTGWAGIIPCEHEKDRYYALIKGLENEKEGGKRCEVCFTLRLTVTAEIAEKLGYDYFTTTLTISPLKDAFLLNEIGAKLAEGKKVKWLYSDFKKQNGYLESIKLSKEYSLYRQDYCGCIFSKRDREKEKNT
jgi:predicted adenine nucleotide alpha hydrolase (AANH) superfamily ATPase